MGGEGELKRNYTQNGIDAVNIRYAKRSATLRVKKVQKRLLLQQGGEGGGRTYKKPNQFSGSIKMRESGELEPKRLQDYHRYHPWLFKGEVV